MSAYDKANIDEILAGEGDWFTAELLRFLAAIPQDDRRIFANQFPDEVEAVRGKSLPEGAPHMSLGEMFAKGDSSNKRRIEISLQGLAKAEGGA